MASTMGRIFDRLKSKTQFMKKGGLYISWPSLPVTKRPRRSPLQLPELTPIGYKKRPSWFPALTISLLQSTYYLLAPKQREDQHSRPWIVRVEEVDDDPTTWRVLNPWSGIDNFLKADQPMSGTITCNPSNYLIKELARSYTLVEANVGYEDNLAIKLRKIVPLWDDPNTDVKEEPEKLTFLAIDWIGELYIWKQGDEKWKQRDIPTGTKGVSDIVSCGGKFYGLHKKLAFFEIDQTDDETHKRSAFFEIDPNDEDGLNNYKYIPPPPPPPGVEPYAEFMVVHNGKVHLLFPGDKIMSVYALDIGDGTEPPRWDIVKVLNNEVLFVLSDVSFSLPAYLLDRKFGGDWICFNNDRGYGYISQYGYRGYASKMSGTEARRKFEGFEALNMIWYPLYSTLFLKGNVNSEDGEVNVEDFEFDLPQREYTSLFFPPPPWLQYYYLHPSSRRSYPSVRLDNCSLMP